MRFLCILLIAFLLTSMFSCSKENAPTDYVLTEKNFKEYIVEVESNLDKNAVFVDEFIDLSKNNEMDQETFLKMLSILNISENINVDRLHEINLANNIYETMDQHSLEYSTSDRGKIEEIDCDKLVAIRDVMISECEQYILVIEQACSGAVMIAYWYHEGSCT